MFLVLLALLLEPSGSVRTGPPELGRTTVTALAGRPFWALQVDHGVSDRLDAGLGLDFSSHGVLRPMGRLRGRLFQAGRFLVSLRGAAGVALHTRRASFGNRLLVPSMDTELAVSLDVPLAARLAGFAEVGSLAVTDFSAERSAAFGHGVAGVEWAPGAGVSLLARGGILQGSRGRVATGSAGAAYRF